MDAATSVKIVCLCVCVCNKQSDHWRSKCAHLLSRVCRGDQSAEMASARALITSHDESCDYFPVFSFNPNVQFGSIFI